MSAGRLKTLIGRPLVVVAVLVFLVEEILWDCLAWLTAALGRWAPVARVEAAIRRLPPYLAILLFAVPWAIILPVKLTALWLLASGHLLGGTFLFAGGELFGVGFLARIYVLCRPALATLAWFLRVEGWVKALSAWAHACLDRVALWREARAKLRRIVTRLRDFGLRGSHGWVARHIKLAHRLVRGQFQR